jgi:hypothetical protein
MLCIAAIIPDVCLTGSSRLQFIKSRPEKWLLIKWPKGEAEPSKYWFSTLHQNITFGDLEDLTKLR